MMSPILLPRILDGGAPNMDTLGIFYVVVTIIYTVLVAGELLLLYRHRSAFCVRIRNLKVVFAAIGLLHVYLILVLLVYPENGMFPCSAEYWVMSIFLPLGMALFQACNARVLKAYESQQRLKRNFLEGSRKKRFTFTPRGIVDAWSGLDATHRVYACTIIGLIISFVPTMAVFFGSRRFHSSYGSFGPVVNARECRRGAEWLPSIFIQLFWTAVVGPWLLWKIRNVHDVHYWAWQTRLAIVAGLPGTPLWMAFTYSNISSMMNINKFFPPAGWFLPSLFVCQQVLIIIPLWDAYKTTIRRASISSITTNTSLSTTASISSTTSFRTKELKSKTSMQSLEHVITTNIEPLISWAASREFTAENTIFLREVRNFKTKWSSLTTVTTSQRKQMFTEASLIFFTLVNPFTAETPINIEYKIYRKLQAMFETVEFDPYRPTNPTRAGTPDSRSERENVVCPWEDTLSRPSSVKSEASTSSTKSLNIVPSDFSDEVFDAAYDSIKYLVFTNTWPRYVEAEMGGKVAGPLSP